MINTAGWLLIVTTIGPGGGSVTPISPVLSTEYECTITRDRLKQLNAAFIDSLKKQGSPGVASFSYDCLIVGNPSISGSN